MLRVGLDARSWEQDLSLTFVSSRVKVSQIQRQCLGMTLILNTDDCDVKAQSIFVSFCMFNRDYNGRSLGFARNEIWFLFEPAHEIMVLTHRQTAKAQASLRIHTVLPEPSLFAHKTKGLTKNQTSSPTGWLHMRIWRMSVRWMESTIISWEGSFIFCVFQIDDPLEQAIKFLKPLQLLAADRIETHICAYEIYSRKGKYHFLKLV